MTYKENITAILECYFMGFRKEIIDSACNRILEQEPCKVSEYDKDHIWYRGVQYISLRRFLEVKSLAEEPKWIPVSERLPKEETNPITYDFYEYQCTYHAHGVYDVRSYKYGNGHWWHGAGIMDDSVLAWRENLEPYRAESEKE